ncbi:hypothetical protein MNEG_14063 [Monoraphidium neglectum]|jgi:hypothetical protein|uniref:Uncharacterized protein n=1 Tax=Monoraphidium neglectum TaxID=145388 RepID=A0A0D2J1I2_9CHLO|nr:hypothetical protein MNEG_14063 [Monoraphidium neglectum]KIY93897.1 hypothetical protein MNEG_14063 [Monoraphidium neglectum]|eukprot:XP_013892917.1 hypothetical protein MNEG_14063 [Monoraphidium neglectum]
MVRRCRAADVLVAAMSRPANCGIEFSKKGVHQIMADWAGAAQREDERRAARGVARAARRRREEGAVGDGGGGGGDGEGAEAARQQDESGGEEDEDEGEEATADRLGRRRAAQERVWAERRHKAARAALPRLEAVCAAMAPAGLRPDRTTVYTLVRAAVNAGRPDRAAALEAELRALIGERSKPSLDRLLAASEVGREGGDGGAGGGE